jgi:hypothetical protein
VHCAVTRRGPAPFSPRYEAEGAAEARRPLEGRTFEDVTRLADRMRDHRRSPVTAWHARHVIDTMESTYRSAQAGPTQDLTVSSGWAGDSSGADPRGLSP